MRWIAIGAMIAGVMLAGGAGPGLAQDAAAGEKLYKRLCTACHALPSQDVIRIGPSLAGVAGRAAGSVAGYSYSRALKESGLTWTDENLDAWLSNPRGLVSDNRMTFNGIADATERANLIAYLKGQGH